VDTGANRTPLMTSETPANHRTSLYSYHDNRTTPAACNENRRLFGGIYDERKPMKVVFFIYDKVFTSTVITCAP